MTGAMGKGGVTIVMAIAVAMSAISFFVASPQPIAGNLGICIPSPNLWLNPSAGSWALNLLLLLGCSGGLYFFNRHFSVVPGSSTILHGIFLLMAVSIPWSGTLLSSSSILALAMIAALAILCSAFGQRNAAQELFLVATILSLGSMFQYAFIFMTMPMVIAAILFKCLHIREIFAMTLGLLAPYWIALGFGLVTPDSFNWPTITNLFAGNTSHEALLAGLLNLGITAVITLVLALYNSVKLYAGNTRRRMFNMAINVLGLAAAACMVFDFNNLYTYIATFYIAAAFQIADLFALWNIRRPAIWSSLICLLYISFFTLSIC